MHDVSGPQLNPYQAQQSSTMLRLALLNNDTCAHYAIEKHSVFTTVTALVYVLWMIGSLVGHRVRSEKQANEFTSNATR